MRGRRFAYFLVDHHGDGIIAVCCRVAPGANAALVAADSDRYSIPAYIGPRGWVGLRLDTAVVNWDDVSARVEESYRLIAP